MNQRNVIKYKSINSTQKEITEAVAKFKEKFSPIEKEVVDWGGMKMAEHNGVAPILTEKRDITGSIELWLSKTLKDYGNKVRAEERRRHIVYDGGHSICYCKIGKNHVLKGKK